jgi:dienelactone hydrolase
MILQRIARPLLARAGGGFDVAIVRIAQELSKRGTRKAQTPAQRRAYLDDVAHRYESVDPREFYAAPPPIDRVRETFVREVEGEPRGAVTDVTWPSGWTPKGPDGRDRYLAIRENGVVHVRLMRHPTPRPAIICVHGYRAGTFTFEERAWGMRWLHRLGLDVALFTLPFHALRAPANRRRTPLFPSADVARTIEAFGQAMWDLRGLAAWLRLRGAPQVGIAGMSLGGYTTSLAATVEPAFEFAIPFIPLADMTDVVVEHEALRGTVVPPELIEAGKRSMHLVRPLARTPVIPGERMLVIAAERDRITQGTHAQLLAKHFGCQRVTFPGAHLLQFGRREGFAAMAKFLAGRGVIAPRS